MAEGITSTLPGDDIEQNDLDALRSPEAVEEIRGAVDKMFRSAMEHGAVGLHKRSIHRVESEFDPNAVDPENRRMGAMVERRVPVDNPELQSSEWRTFTDEEKKAGFNWRISYPKDSHEGNPMITLETPLDLPPGDFGLVGAMGTGIALEGRRIQDFVLGGDGTIRVRQADFSKLGPDYRVRGSETVGQATPEQIDFLRNNLGKAELVNSTGQPTGVKAQAIAPELAGQQ